jgi:hypothetical protein
MRVMYIPMQGCARHAGDGFIVRTRHHQWLSSWWLGSSEVVGNGSGDVPYWQLRFCKRISSSVVRRILRSTVFPKWGFSGGGNFPYGCGH